MFDAFFSAILVQAFGDGFDGSGVDEVMGSDCDGTGTGQHEFDGVLPGRDAAQAEDGDGYGLSRLPYHAQGDGLDSRAGQAAGDIAQQVLMSMAMPVRVLMSDTASAPAASTALAMTVISVTFGDSLTMTGFRVWSLTLRVTAAAASG